MSTNYGGKDIRDDPSHWKGLETIAFSKQIFLHLHDHTFSSADLPLLNPVQYTEIKQLN